MFALLVALLPGLIVTGPEKSTPATSNGMLSTDLSCGKVPVGSTVTAVTQNFLQPEQFAMTLDDAFHVQYPAVVSKFCYCKQSSASKVCRCAFSASSSEI